MRTFHYVLITRLIRDWHLFLAIEPGVAHVKPNRGDRTTSFGSGTGTPALNTGTDVKVVTIPGGPLFN